MFRLCLLPIQLAALLAAVAIATPLLAAGGAGGKFTWGRLLEGEEGVSALDRCAQQLKSLIPGHTIGKSQVRLVRNYTWY